MSRYHSYLNTSAGIIGRYNGDVPLAVFLKSFFAADKKYGSKDRKQISHLCYCYYRTGKIFQPGTFDNTDALQALVLAGLFLCSSQPDELLWQLRPAWNENTHLSIEEKWAIINSGDHSVKNPAPAPHCSLLSVFPWKAALSGEIDHAELCRSFFVQPDLFLRIRPGFSAVVEQKTEAAGIPYRLLHENCMVLDNAAKIDVVIDLDKEAVIQDYNSQRVAEFLEPLQRDEKLRVWDCCAASGGKAILTRDVLKNIILTVTDIRKSILSNLKKRFAAAGIKKYFATVADLTRPLSVAGNPKYDLIICDLPCSGSGTWSRTPEQLYFWQEDKLGHYVDLQRKITRNVIPFLKPGGYLLYITCSVFKAENEDRVRELEESFGLKLIRKEMLRGYDKKADTLFAALLMRPPEEI